MDLRRQCLADGEQSNSSRTSVRLGALFWSAQADIFFTESLRILAERLSQLEIGLPLRLICYDSPPEMVGVFSTEIKISPTSYRVFPVWRTPGYRADFYFHLYLRLTFCECFFSFCHLHTSPHKPHKIFVLITYNLLRSASLASS